MNAFDKFPQPNPSNEHSSPPFSFDDIDFDAITKKVLAERKFGEAPKPAVETYDFSNERIVEREDRVARDRKAANELLKDIKRVA